MCWNKSIQYGIDSGFPFRMLKDREFHLANRQTPQEGSTSIVSESVGHCQVENEIRECTAQQNRLSIAWQ
jgi:hypothetical protein